MLSIFIVQLPFSVCAVWFLLVLLKGHKDHSDRLMMFVMALLAISFFCGSSHMDPVPNYRKLVIVDIIMQFSTIAVFPFICFYIRSCYEESRERTSAYLLLLPAILQTTSTVVLTVLLGVNHASELLRGLYLRLLIPDMLDVTERAYYVLSLLSYHLLFFISIALSVVYMVYRLFVGKFKFVHALSFLRGQKASFVANMLCVLFFIFFILWAVCVLFGTLFMNSLSIWSSLWSIVTSILLFLVGYVAAIPPLPGGYMSIEKMRHPFTSLQQSRQDFLKGIDSGPVADAPASGYDKIMDSFKQLMITDQGFLNPSMTIDELAAQLNTNRTYVSKLVNIYYGMPFRDYLNKLRMDYAKQLMIDEPDAVIDYVAAKSGFQSSTQFIRKFRETEGVTPSVWRTSLRQKK